MEYFPTRAYKNSVMRMRNLLSKEKERLDAVACARGGGLALDRENLAEELPRILEFSRSYQEAFSRYLEAVLPQHPAKVRCRSGCGNCCRHFPMSVEPFELIEFYACVRESAEFVSYLEECLFCAKSYHSILEVCEGKSDPDEEALVRYFGKRIPCPFLLKSGSCGVYPVRPVTCRMYFSETPGEYCVPEHLQTDRNRSFIVYLPDDLEVQIAEISAHYRELDLPESLYEGVVAMNAYEPEFSRAAAEVSR